MGHPPRTMTGWHSIGANEKTHAGQDSPVRKPAKTTSIGLLRIRPLENRGRSLQYGTA
ncbi:MAG: hypothetical protein ACFE9C_17730 [Candidatus Hodarchaeota archaeon]